MKKLALAMTLVLTGCTLIPVNPKRRMKAAPANPPKNCVLVNSSPDSPLHMYQCGDEIVFTWGGGR